MAVANHPVSEHDGPIYEACVGTCKGTYCDPAFANQEVAIKFIDEAEDDCEKNGTGLQ